MPTRLPAVAGQFYPGTRVGVDAAVRDLFAGLPSAARAALAVMCPHAGWIYSGKLAAKTLAAVAIPERVVVLCPNHTGRGASVAVFPDGAWAIPGAEIAIDADLAGHMQPTIVRRCRYGLRVAAERRTNARRIQALEHTAESPFIPEDWQINPTCPLSWPEIGYQSLNFPPALFQSVSEASGK